MMSAINCNFIQNVMKIGSYYWKKTLDQDELLRDWWKSYLFIADRIFYQGRKDALSKIIKNMAEEVLVAKIDIMSNTGLARLTQEELKDISNVFAETRINEKKYKRPSDVRMLFDILTFMHRLPDSNLVRYIHDEIKADNLDNMYHQLDKIYSIDHKIASFILRDVVDLYYEELGVVPSVRRTEGQILLQPIDTWVEQVAKMAGIEFEEKDSALDKALRIVESCRSVTRKKRKAIQFNQGAYLLGSKSHEILVPLLSKQLELDTFQSIKRAVHQKS